MDTITWKVRIMKERYRNSNGPLIGTPEGELGIKK